MHRLNVSKDVLPGRNVKVGIFLARITLGKAKSGVANTKNLKPHSPWDGKR